MAEGKTPPAPRTQRENDGKTTRKQTLMQGRWDGTHMMPEFRNLSPYKLERASFAYGSLRDAQAKQGRPLPIFDELPENEKLAWVECTDKVCARYQGLY